MRSAEYALADMVRNPRRTLSTMIGVTLGVGLFCGVLFFVDGVSASMTQRAVAPLPIDMQRIVTERVGSSLVLTQTFEPDGPLSRGRQARVLLELHNPGGLDANEVTIRSAPDPALAFVAGSAELDGEAITGFEDNPFAHGPGRTGFNIGTVPPGATRRIGYLVEATVTTVVDDATVMSAYSTRESVNPTAANRPSLVSLDELASEIARLAGVAHASQLSIADLGSDTLGAGDTTASGPAKIFGFDDDYASRDSTIEIIEGNLGSDSALLSVEAAEALRIGIGDTVTVELPDGSAIDLPVAGIADLSRSRSLFSSRRGGDLETFVYVRNAVIVSPTVFAETVQPAYERAAVSRGARLKNPPIREVDITLERDLLDAEPSTALIQTQRIGEEIAAVAAHQDYLLDNISNTLGVAAADAEVAKRLFVFLGLPGGLLAAMLAAYAGNVLATAERREQATLRIRGASRRHLLGMLLVRTTILTAAGSLVGLATGYFAAVAILGSESLDRASTSSLVTSALLGTSGGFLATGTALYATGRRSLDREIDSDRARLLSRPPLWRRARIDVIGGAVVVAGTIVALRTDAFDGTPGSVYFGRAVELNLMLLVLPVAVWITGSVLAARLIGRGLARSRPRSTPLIGRPLPSLFRRSIGRRPWAISNGAVVASLIVALATSFAAFISSYDAAKVEDARYANGGDIRITPALAAERTYTVDDAASFEMSGVAASTPVIYGLSNVVLRSDRTSDPANLAAIDPTGFVAVAPVTSDTAAALQILDSDPNAVLLSREMAAFLETEPGDSLQALLARSTDDQVEVELNIAGLFERLPGFPDGADAVMSIARHTADVPAKPPDFFLLALDDDRDRTLEEAVTALQRGPAATDRLRVDTRATTLARDQSSLAALNIAGLVDLDAVFALAMVVVTVAIFVFGLLLQRRREYVTLRAQGVEPSTIRMLIMAEAGTVAIAGAIAGLLVGVGMGFYFVTVLRPLFVLSPAYTVPLRIFAPPVALVIAATLASSFIASRLVNQLEPTELLRDE